VLLYQFLRYHFTLKVVHAYVLLESRPIGFLNQDRQGWLVGGHLLAQFFEKLVLLPRRYE
jgi:hypothetical protein